MSNEASNNGRRWYDPNKIIWGLFSIVSLLVIGGVTMAWGKLNDGSDRIHRLEKVMERTDERYQEIIRRLDRIEKRSP